jgi:UDP-N-acetylglucosamine diphosphorylase/glucosamine-1-phosphate N-acetyltransferase
MLRVCLVEDAKTGQLEPLSATRPVFDLLTGMTSLADKQRSVFAVAQVDVCVRPELAALQRQSQPTQRVNELTALLEAAATEPVYCVNARWLPDERGPALPALALAQAERTAAAAWVIDGQLALVRVDAPSLARFLSACPAEDQPLQFWPYLEQLANRLPQFPIGGRLVEYLWELVAANGEQIGRDLAARRPTNRAGFRPGTFEVVGRSEALLIDPSARIDPFVVADTTQGPVVIDRHAVVTAFTRLEGPCWIGPYAQVHGAKIRAGTSLGPHSRVGGEVEASIIQGYTNKYHDGFLGHSYLGEWVNFGAGTHTSDLRNDYATVRVVQGNDLIPTGQAKVGSFVGDHVKTGLGVLLNTGSHIGPFAQLLPNGQLLPKFVPAFGQYRYGTLIDTPDPSAFISIAEVAMRRRGVVLTEAHRQAYLQLHARTTPLRRAAIREAEQRRLRRSA